MEHWIKWIDRQSLQWNSFSECASRNILSETFHFFPRFALSPGRADRLKIITKVANFLTKLGCSDQKCVKICSRILSKFPTFVLACVEKFFTLTSVKDKIRRKKEKKTFRDLLSRTERTVLTKTLPRWQRDKWRDVSECCWTDNSNVEDEKRKRPEREEEQAHYDGFRVQLCSVDCADPARQTVPIHGQTRHIPESRWQDFNWFWKTWVWSTSAYVRSVLQDDIHCLRHLKLHHPLGASQEVPSPNHASLLSRLRGRRWRGWWWFVESFGSSLNASFLRSVKKQNDAL